MNRTTQLNIKASEPFRAECTDFDESDLIVSLDEAELSRVSGGVADAGQVHRF